MAHRFSKLYSNRFYFMNKSLLSLAVALLMSLLLMSSCSSYNTWSRTATGMSLGSMFGSTIGSIVGGYDGSRTGMLLGGAVGALAGNVSARASEAPRRDYTEERTSRSQYVPQADVRYGDYQDYAAPFGRTAQLEVTQVVFADDSGNHSLQPGERAYITFHITNRGNSTVRNVAPIVRADYNRINISPTAIVGDLHAGQTIRYTAAVVAKRNARQRMVNFVVAFPDASGKEMPASSFSVPVVK